MSQALDVDDLNSQAVDLELDSLLTHAFNAMTTTLKKPAHRKALGSPFQFCSYELLLDDCQLYATLKESLTVNDFALLQVTYSLNLTSDMIYTVYTTLLPVISNFASHGQQLVPARFATIAILAECQQRNLFNIAMREIPNDTDDATNESVRKAYYRVYTSYTHTTRLWIQQARHAAKLVLLHTITDQFDEVHP